MFCILTALALSLKIQINGKDAITAKSIEDAIKQHRIAPFGVYKVYITEGSLSVEELASEGRTIISTFPNMEEFVMLDGTSVSTRSIPDFAFKGSVLKRLSLAGVDKIGKEAFANGNYLKSADIKCVKEIGELAFSRCPFLEDVKIGDLKVLESKSFQDCYILPSFVIPSTVAHLEKSVFHGCHVLKYLEIRASVSEIPEGFLFGMRKLDTVIIPTSVKHLENTFMASVNVTIAKSASYCPTDSELTIPPYARHIGTEAYSDCKKVKKLFIHKDIETIGFKSFSGLDSLVSIEFEENSKLSFIYDEAFSNCKSLVQVELPRRLMRVGSYIFKHSWALRIINVHDDFDLEWHCEGLNSETHAKVVQLFDPVPTPTPGYKYRYTPFPTRKPQPKVKSERPKFTKKRENIVFFFSDQQRWDTIGPNGQKLDISPYLDQLAREGVNFKNCFSVQPVCGPLRAAIQTGVYPTETGCFKNAVPLPLGITTIPRKMKEAGYHLAYIGKWHLASDTGNLHYETISVPPEYRGGWDEYWVAADVLEFTSHGYGGYVWDTKGNKREFTGYRTDCVTDYALEYIRNYDDDEKPFFLFLSHIEPHHQNDHCNYEGPEGSKEKFRDFERPADLLENKGDWKKWYPDYLGCCNALDKNLGRVIEALKEKGIYDDTLIAYSSDHGNHFKVHSDDVEPGGGDDYKRNAYEASIHIPLVVKGRDFYGGYDEDTFVTSLDFGPTFCRIAGIEPPEHWKGHALQDIKNTKFFDNIIYIQVSESFVGRAIRTPMWTYVIHAKGKNPYNHQGNDQDEWTDKHLFDLENDPIEVHDLKDDPAYKDIKEELRRILKEKAFIAGEGNFTIVDLPSAGQEL